MVGTNMDTWDLTSIQPETTIDPTCVAPNISIALGSVGLDNLVKVVDLTKVIFMEK
jgi:hypothetical protein